MSQLYVWVSLLSSIFTFPGCFSCVLHKQHPFPLAPPSSPQYLAKHSGQLPGRYQGSADSMFAIEECLMSQGLEHLCLIVN